MLNVLINIFMELFKKLENCWLEEIQQSLLQKLAQLPYKTVQLKYNDIEWYLNNISGLQQFVQSLGINKIKAIFLMSTQPSQRSDIHHVDYSNWIDRSIGINIPIENTKDTSMIWYDNVKPHDLTESIVYGKFHTFVEGDEIGRLELDQTYLVRTDVPHSIENLTTKYRYILSIYPEQNLQKIQNMWPNFSHARRHNISKLTRSDSNLQFVIE